MTLAQAKTALKNKNLVLGSVTYTVKDTTDPTYVPTNKVYIQDPLSGVKVKPGDSVDITIDGNPPP
jgi:beta-lactam-binding protein with PASTA domain